MLTNRKYAPVRLLQEKLLQQKVLLAQKEIETAIAQLANVKPILKSVCEQIQACLGFNFVAISLISRENQTIETVCGTGIAAKWSNQCRHYLEPNPQLRDIQADIVLTRHTEIIRGEDSRFDPWIYQRYEHQNLMRIFTPILVVKDKYGKVCHNWFNPSQLHVISNQTSQQGSRIVLSTQIPTDFYSVEVIGTVEAGYFVTHTPSEHILSIPTINLERAEDFVTIVANKTKEIYYPLLSHALDVITERMCDVLSANAVSIKLFPQQDNWSLGSRESRIGYVDYRQYGVDLELEKQRLGERVLRKKEPHIKHYRVSPQFAGGGQQNTESLTIAAYPYDFEEMQGLILIECVGKSALIRKKNGWLELYLQRAAHAIWYATTYARQNVQTSQLTNLHGFTESLTQLSDPKELFSQIAWETLHILAADVVVIYEYDRTTQEFITPPDIAGRLICTEKMKSEVGSDNVPQKLINYGLNTYSNEVENNPLFQNSDFSQREQIKSAAGILLKIQDEIVGVIFINYRREFCFSDSVRTLIETLASSIAIAIKNQRWLGNWVEALNDIDLKIITANQQEELLHQIVERAASATNANFAAIRLVNKVNQTLETCAIYPPSCPRTSGKYLSSFDEGITGWVAKNRMPQRVDDVSKDQRYRAFFPDVGSELCVPLIDKNNYLLGVLNVESQKIKAFNPRDLKMLQMVGELAVIGIQSLQNKKRSIQIERMATLGDVAAPFMHRINNKVGAIRVLTQDILREKQVDEQINTNLEMILESAETALKEAEFLEKLKAKPQDNQWISLSEIFPSLKSLTTISPNIIYNQQISPDLPKVNCVKIQLSEAFDALIQNAIEAMPKGGELCVTAECIEGSLGCWLEVKIIDTGVGIAADKLERIFEPGFTTKGEGNGHMGFALWWLQSYIEGLGGELKVKSELGVGSEFKVILPASRGYSLI